MHTVEHVASLLFLYIMYTRICDYRALTVQCATLIPSRGTEEPTHQILTSLIAHFEAPFQLSSLHAIIIYNT